MVRKLVSYGLVVIITLILAQFYNPFTAIQTIAQGTCQTFPETGKTVCGKFLDYWKSHGGLAQQGYPISAEFAEVSDLDGKSYTVQYFERSVFEMHPENAAPNDVLLSQLGTFQFGRKYAGEAGSDGQSVSIKDAGDNKSTAPFYLAGGTYVSDWTAKVEDGHETCGFFLRMLRITESAGGISVASSDNVVATDPKSQSGSTFVYAVDPGQYYVTSNTGCGAWTLSLHRP